MRGTREFAKGMFAVLLTAAVLVLFVACGPVLAKIPEKVRVGIITSNAGSLYRDANVITFSVKGNYQIIDLAAIPGGEVLGTPAEGEVWQAYYLPSGVQIYRNGNPQKITTGPIMVKEISHSKDNRTCLSGYKNLAGISAEINKWYRGNMEFRSSGSALTAINELPMDEYLYGVVPREMSDGWPQEALKAQAVAARTYTVANYNKRILEGFNVLDTQYDQAYGGFNSEGSNSTRAVDGTSGKIVLYDGKPISAVYHSTSGGYTEDNNNVWNSVPIPYLRGKADPYSTVQGFANWNYSTSLDDVRNRIIQAGYQLGPISSFALDKLPSGRVNNVMITDINGNTISMTGTAFGQMFNPKFYTYISNTNFMSRFFDIKTDQVIKPKFSVLNGAGQKASVEGTKLYGLTDEGNVTVINDTSAEFYVTDANGTMSYNKSATGTVAFAGHGWGHGVGMSQWGAYEMAKQGKTYMDILNFYYTGVAVTDNNV